MRATTTAVLAALLAACGASAPAPASQGGDEPGEPAEPGGAPAASIPEVGEPPPPGAESILATLAPARLDATDEDQMAEIAGASAPRVFFVGMIPLLAVGGGGEREEELTCPERVEGDGVVIYRGGCTDEDGTRWTGSAVIRGLSREERTGDVTYRGFGFERTVECAGGPRESHWRADGRFAMQQNRFTIDLAFQGEGVDDECNEMLGTGGLLYEGRTTNTGSAARWSGSGRYGWEGFGVVEATTEDELINQRNCRQEALMGTTTVRGAEHTVTFQYDGAEDCDEESTVSWSFDGQPQGELAGVACHASGRGPVSSWWLLVLLGVVARHGAGGPARRSA